MDKSCSKCKLVKPLDLFYKSKDGLYGRRSSCKECCATHQRTSRIQYRKDYYKANKSKMRTNSDKWKTENLDRYQEIKKRWQKNNPLKSREYSHKRRTRIVTNGGHITAKQIKILFEKYKNCCYCGMSENLSLDHLIPISRGGSNSLENIVVSCILCNKSKFTKTPEEWKKDKG